MTDVTARPSTDARLRTAAAARFRASAEATTAFFDVRSGELARACLDLAKAFHGGQRLLVAGTGAAASDAVHVSVEFVHPVIVGKRALPAIALTQDPADWLEAMAEPGDVVLALAPAPDPGTSEPARAALAVAQERGCRTIALVGAATGEWSGDHVIAVESDDPLVVQEVAETAYHVLWELVHVFLDHPELLE